MQKQKIALGENLIYILGDKKVISGSKLIVELDLEKVYDFASYDKKLNALKINGKKMKKNDAGTYKIPIKASYKYPNGLTQKFESMIILEIFDDRQYIDRQYIYKPKYKSQNPKNKN